MSFFWSFINLLDVFFNLRWMNYYFFPMIGIAFVATVPCLIRFLLSWR